MLQQKLKMGYIQEFNEVVRKTLGKVVLKKLKKAEPDVVLSVHTVCYSDNTYTFYFYPS